MVVPFQGYEIAVGLVSIMIAVSGMILGIGIAVGDRRLKEIGRDELYQSIINGVLVGALFAALVPGGIVNNLVNSLAPSSVQCSGVMSANYAICFASNFLTGLIPVSIGGHLYPTLMDSTLGLLVPAAAIYGTVSFIASIKVTAVFVSFGFGTLLQPVVSMLGYVIEALSFTLASLEIQGVLLYFVAATSLTALLPIGLILRSFYFTRRLGGTIIAITIALFVVFPLTYVMDAQLVSAYSAGTSGIGSISSTANSLKESVGGSLMSANVPANVLAGISSGITSFVSMVEGDLSGIMNVVAMVVVEAFFLPLFSIMLTIVSAREIARILGSELSFGKFDMF